MERLNGKAILVGKEPGSGRLLVAVAGTGKCAMIGKPGSVPNCVSRCKPAEQMAHMQIEVDAAGNISVVNLKPQNVTYVDGQPVSSLRVNKHSRVELGKERFNLNLGTVLESAKSLLPEPAKKYDISHLQTVWNDYKQVQKDIRDKQRRINLLRTVMPLFTIGSGFMLQIIGKYAYILTGIALLVTIYVFLGMKNDKSAEKLEKATEDFQDKYVCPHCGKFLGNMSYRMMKKQYSMHCPYCKCEFVEK